MSTRVACFGLWRSSSGQIVVRFAASLKLWVCSNSVPSAVSSSECGLRACADGIPAALDGACGRLPCCW